MSSGETLAAQTMFLLASNVIKNLERDKFFRVLSSVYQAWMFISCQLTQIMQEYYRYDPGAHFSKVLKTFQAQKAVLCLSCLYARLKFQEF